MDRLRAARRTAVIGQDHRPLRRRRTRRHPSDRRHGLASHEGRGFSLRRAGAGGAHPRRRRLAASRPYGGERRRSRLTVSALLDTLRPPHPLTQRETSILALFGVIAFTTGWSGSATLDDTNDAAQRVQI